MELTLLHGLVISLSLGALIGMVRQWADEHGKVVVPSIAGLRTFGLWSLLGFLAAAIGERHHTSVFPVMLGLFGLGLVVTGYARSRQDREESNFGQTTIAAGLLTFFAGAMVFWKEYSAAVAVGAGVSIILASKPIVHGWTQRLTNQDIYLFLQFCAVSGLILPLVPNQGFGPMDGINPFRIWLMVVLISGLGFVGYIAVRLLGAGAGILVTGVAGGLASSTATTLAFTRASKDSPELASSLAMGIVVASTIMLGRVWVLIYALNAELGRATLLPMMVMAVPSVLFIAWRQWASRARNDSVDAPTLSNPLSLKMAIKFALIYAVVALFVRWTGEGGAEAGFYPVAFLSGLTDMDAIALSLAAEYKGAVDLLDMAARGVVLAAVANTIFKMGFALSLGSKPLRSAILLGMAPMAVVGAGAIFLV